MRITRSSLHKRPHRDLAFVAPDIVEFGFDGVGHLQPVVDRGHLQSTLHHCLPVHLSEPRVFANRLCIPSLLELPLLISPPLFFALLANLFNELSFPRDRARLLAAQCDPPAIAPRPLEEALQVLLQLS